MCALLRQLFDIQPDNPTLVKINEHCQDLYKDFEDNMGCIEMRGKSCNIERVYFYIKSSHALQWNDQSIKVRLCNFCHYNERAYNFCLWIYSAQHICFLIHSYSHCLASFFRMHFVIVSYFRNHVKSFWIMLIGPIRMTSLKTLLIFVKILYIK